MRGKTPEDRRLLEMLDPVAEAVGYEIVRLRMMGGAARRTLQIMAERPDGEMNVDDCAALSRAVGDVLDAADVVAGDYVLEVSSPGIDRPLTRLKDFEAWEGYEAKLELDRLVDGRKRFRGVLAGIETGAEIGAGNGLENGAVCIDLEGEEDTTVIPFDWITEAKLSLTDELLKRGAELREQRLAEEAGDDDDTNPSDEDA